MDPEPDCPPPLVVLIDEEPPPVPAGLISGILVRVRARLMLRDAIDLMTAGFVRVLTDGLKPRAGPGRRSKAGDEFDPRP
jgi:hypothetical protein